MIQSSIAAFIASYFSVFHASRMDLFWLLFIPVVGFLIFFSKSTVRAVFVGLFFYLWTQAAVQWQLDSRYNLEQKATVTLDIVITQLPQVKERSVGFMAKPLRVIKSDTDFDFLKLKRIKLNWYQPKQKVKGGQIWRFNLRLQSPHGYQNGEGFDYERWMFSEGISATGYVLNKEQPKLLGESSNFIILQIRSWLSEKIKKQAEGLRYLSLFQTLSMGDKSLLDSSLKQLFVDTGTAHLLVISGLHVGLLSLMFYFIASRLWLISNVRFKTRLNQRDFAVICAWLAALVYSALAGFSLPTLRALIMLSLVFFALLKRQSFPFLNVFSVAVILVLLLMPLSLLSFSFWLSFLAVLLIVVSQYGLKSISKFKAILLLQFLFALLFIPLNAVVFNQLIISSFLANLVLIPVMGFFVIPVNLLATLLSVFDWSWLGYIYQLLDAVIGVLVSYLIFLNDTLGGAQPLPGHNGWLMLISAFGAVLLIVLRHPYLKLPAAFLMVMPWFYQSSELSNGGVSAVFFDVGMGTSVLIKTQHHALLYDVGPGNQSSYQPAKWVIKPYLQANNILFLDRAVISHSDQDHYGGFWGLMNEPALENSFLLTGTKRKIEALFSGKYSFKNCHQQKSWIWDGVIFRFFPLISTDFEDDNNQSCVLKVTSQHGSILLTGDIEQVREQELLSFFRDELKSDVMLMPHHGSKTSSSNLFLEAVQPKYAIATTGYLNRWGFPKKDIVSRYDALGITTFNTAVEGLIAITIDENNIHLKLQRHQQNALWH